MRADRNQTGESRGSKSHPDVPRCRHTDGGVQDLRRIMGLSGSVLFAHWRRATVLRVHVCIDRKLHRTRVAVVRFSLHASSAVCGDGRIVRCYLREFLHAPLLARCAAALVRCGVGAFWEDVGLFSNSARVPPNAVAGWICAGVDVYLVRGKHWHVHGCVALPGATPRMDDSAYVEAGCVVIANDHQLRDGQCRSHAQKSFAKRITR